MEEGVVVTFNDDGCAVVTMRNGENRVNPTLIKQLNSALDQVEKNTACKMMVTTGTGKFFSNGFDIKWYLQQDPSDALAFIQIMADCFWRIAHFPIPTVAAINGHAFGAGAFIAIAHDYRIMRSDRGWITWNEILHNFSIRGSLRQLMQVKLTTAAIRESVLFAKRLTAEKAMKLGIVDQITDQNSLISESIVLGRNALGQNNFPRSSLQSTKMDLFPQESAISKL